MLKTINSLFGSHMYQLKSRTQYTSLEYKRKHGVSTPIFFCKAGKGGFAEENLTVGNRGESIPSHIYSTCPQTNSTPQSQASRFHDWSIGGVELFHIRLSLVLSLAYVSEQIYFLGGCTLHRWVILRCQDWATLEPKEKLHLTTTGCCPCLMLY